MKYLAVVAVAGAFGLYAYAQASPGAEVRETPAPPHRIVSNIHFVGTMERAVFLIATRDGHILVGAGPEAALPLIRGSVEKLGFRYEEVRILLSSHARAEQAGALARIKAETGGRVMAMAADAALLRRGGRGDPHVGDARPFPPVTVDRVLEDEDVIELGGQRLLARHTPGHTPGGATFVTTVQENGRAMQMVFAASTAFDPQAGITTNPRYPGAMSDWQRTFAILESLVADVWVSPRPGDFDLQGKLKALGQTRSNPYIDPQGYRRHLAESRTALSSRLAAELAER